MSMARHNTCSSGLQIVIRDGTVKAYNHLIDLVVRSCPVVPSSSCHYCGAPSRFRNPGRVPLPNGTIPARPPARKQASQAFRPSGNFICFPCLNSLGVLGTAPTPYFSQPRHSLEALQRSQ